MELDYMTRKEVLEMSLKIARERGLSMCKVHNLLEEMDDLEDAIQSASEINAERGMSAACSGFNPYDIERIHTGKETKRLREIAKILFPVPIWETNVENAVIDEDDLPF